MEDREVLVGNGLQSLLHPGSSIPYSVLHTAYCMAVLSSIRLLSTARRIAVGSNSVPVSYTHLRAHETEADL
eukprot:733252-Rhodomonas_salina.2